LKIVSESATDGQITDLANELLEWLQQRCGSAHTAGVVCSIVLYEIAGPGATDYLDAAKAAVAAGAYKERPSDQPE
jgi:hypothetical protein